MVVVLLCYRGVCLEMELASWHLLKVIWTGFNILTILQQNLKNSAQDMGILSIFIIYQDNDSNNTAHIVQLWLFYNCPKVLHPPPQSPDLNSIEHVWDRLEKKVHKTPIYSKDHLKQTLQEEWAKLPRSYMQKLVQSMPNRLREVLKRKGRHTKY